MKYAVLDRHVILALLVAGLAVASGPIGLRGAQPGGAPVKVQFRAVAEDGQPILDLKAADVSLRFNGKTREIRSLELIQLGAATGAAASPALPAPFASNVSSDPGRDVLIAYDDASLMPGKEQSLRDGVAQILDGLTSRDRAGLVSVRSGGASLPLTNQFATIKNALAPIHGGAPNSETMDNFVCRSRTAVDTLMALMKAPTERPQTVVFFTASLGISPPEQRGGQMGQQSGLCQLLPAIFQDFANAVSRSNTTFYPVQVVEGVGVITSATTAPRSPGGPPLNAQATVEGLENLAGAGGTTLVRLSGNNSPGLTRILKE